MRIAGKTGPGNGRAMLDYLLEVHRLLQWAFNLWFIGIVFVPLFLAVILTYWISNLFTFRPLKLRAVREVRYLRARIYNMRGADNRRPATEYDWIDIEVNFCNELEQVAEEMESVGFLSTGRVIRQHIAKVQALINDARASQSVVNFDLVGRGSDEYHRHVDNVITEGFHHYWRSGHLEFVAAMERLNPTFFEFINCPTFARWHREAASIPVQENQPEPGRVI